MNYILKNKLKSPLRRDLLTINLPDGSTHRFALRSETIVVGRADTNDLIIKHESISRRHARLQWNGKDLFVEDLASMNKTWVADQPIPPFTPVQVSLRQSFWVGKVEVRYQRQDFTYPLLTIFGVFALIIIFITLRPKPQKKDPFVCNAPNLLIIQPDPKLIPVLQPTQEPQPTVTAIPEATSELLPAETQTETVQLTPTIPAPTNPIAYYTLHFLDLPFPYLKGDDVKCQLGSDAEFIQASQLAWMGGRFTSFFDHQFPKYPAKWGGLEGADPPESTSLLLFTGELSYEVDYSGHPGYDFSTHGPDTPVCAAANGIVAQVDGTSESGIKVKINHTVVYNGKTYQFQTFYLHLLEDGYWHDMLPRLGQRVNAYERIGTMDNTGHSTGPHLHFEVRRDDNQNGIFEQVEVVDPYGYIPSKDNSTDPWEHKSDYLWIHPMGITTAIPASGNSQTDNQSGIGGASSEGEDRPARLCAPAGTLPGGGTLSFSVSLSPPPAENLVSIGRAVVISVLDNNGKFVENFKQDIRVMIPFSKEESDYVTHNSKLGIYRLEMNDKGEMGWLKLASEPPDFANGIAVAYTNSPGQFALLGESADDKYPPRTQIELSGKRNSDGIFYDAVTVTISATDGQSDVKEIQWTKDDMNWYVYKTPIAITPNGTPVPVPAAEGDTFPGGPGRFQIKAYAIDNAENTELSHPAVVRFVIDPSKAPTAITGSPSPEGLLAFLNSYKPDSLNNQPGTLEGVLPSHTSVPKRKYNLTTFIMLINTTICFGIFQYKMTGNASHRASLP
jgi:murein DD-endopeptidase MepM/ murein hydrolase activator NlpD